MIDELTAIIAAFAIGWLCHAILQRFVKPAQRQQRRRPTNGRPVQLKRPNVPTVSPWVGPAKAAAAAETREVQRLRAKLAAASEVCELAGQGQRLESVLAELDGGKP
jgi:hypothetical protein